MPIKPYNYQNPQASAPSTSGNIKPYSYADYTPPAPAAPQQSLKDKIIDKVKKYASDTEQTVYDTGNAILHPVDTLKKLPGVFTKPFMEGIKKASTPVDGTGISADVAQTANLINGVAQSLFSPITGAFQVAEHIPGLKAVADAINVPFSALGFAGSFASGKAVDWMPIPDESKAIIKAPLQELGSLATQIAFGGKVMGKISGKLKAGEEITPEVAKTVVEEVKKELPYHEKTPAELHAEYARSQGYEPYQSPDTLPTIDAGATPKGTLPTIEAGAPAPSAPAGYKYEPLTPDVRQTSPSEPLVAPSTPELAPKTPEVVPTRPLSQENTDIAPSGTAPSPLAQSIAKELDTQLKDVAGYTPSTVKEQARIFNEEVLPKGRDYLRDVITGKESLPEGMKSFPFTVAAEKYLKENPDFELAYKLQNSPHVTAGSESASNLGLGQTREKTTFVSRMQDIKKAKAAKLGEARNKQVHEIPKKVRGEMKKVNLGPEDLGKLDKFIDNIVC